jgi:hypothetical protein
MDNVKVAIKIKANNAEQVLGSFNLSNSPLMISQEQSKHESPAIL